MKKEKERICHCSAIKYATALSAQLSLVRLSSAQLSSLPLCVQKKMHANASQCATLTAIAV